MTQTEGSGPTTGSQAGAEDWAARWVAKFGVYHQRRFGAGTAVTPPHVTDFMRLIAVGWRVPEWQQHPAQPLGAIAGRTLGLA